MGATAQATQGDGRRQQLVIRLLALGIALACVASTVVSLLLVKASVNTVFILDQWETVRLYERAVQGALSFGDLIAQHNEHRILLSRLIMLLDYAIDAGRNRVNLTVIMLIQVLHAVLFVLICRHITASRPLRLALAAFVVLLLFGIYQYENFISGFQSAFLAVQLLFTASAYTLASAQEHSATGRPHLLALIAGLGFGIAAALTMANGALALLCVAFTFALSGWLNRITLLVAAIGLLVFATYALTFTPHPGHTPLAFSLAHPLLVAGHVAMYLGAIFFAFGPAAAIAAGAVAVLSLCASLLALAVGAMVRNRANVALVAVMVFVAATALMTALGRASFGIEQASASRYCGTSAIFWAALTCLSVGIIAEKSDRPKRDAVTVALAALGGMAVVVLISIALTQHRYRAVAQSWNRTMLQATAALLTGAPDTAALKAVFPDMALLERFRTVLMSRQLSIFAEIRPWELGTAVADARIIDNPALCSGRVERIDALPDAPAGVMKVEGWSWNAPAGRPFDRLVFLSETGAISGYAMTVPHGWATKLDGSAPDRPGSRWYGYLHAGPARVFGVLPEDRLCRLAPSPPQVR